MHFILLSLIILMSSAWSIKAGLFELSEGIKTHWITELEEQSSIQLFDIQEKNDDKRDLSITPHIIPNRGKRALEQQLVALPNPTTPEFISRSNIGLFLKKQGKVNVATSYILQVWEIKPPKFQGRIIPAVNCTKMSSLGADPLKTYLSSLCTLLKKTNEDIQKVQSSAMHSIRTMAKILDDLTGNHQNIFSEIFKSIDIDALRRLIRGLFDFVGDFQKKLFGVATTDDVKQIGVLKEKVDVMEDYMKDQFNKQNQNLIKFSTLVNDRFEVLTSDMSAMANALNQTITEFGKKFNELGTKVEALTWYLIEITSDIHKELSVRIQNDQFMSYLQEWARSIDVIINSISSAASGILNANLIPPETLGRLVTQYSDQLKEQGMKLTYGKDSIQAYYTQPLASVYIDETILFILKMPVTQHDSIFDLWKTYVFEVPLTVDKMIYTKLIGIPDYIASSVNPGTPRIMELSTSDIVMCKGDTVLECPSGLQIPTFESASCVRSILSLESINKINETCQYEVYNRTVAPKSKIKHLGKNTWLVHTFHTDWSLHCPNSEPSPVEPQPSAVIAMPCFCYLKIQDQTIPAGIDDRCKIFSKVEVWPTFNAWAGLKYEALDTKGLLTGIMTKNSISFDYKKLQGLVPSTVAITSRSDDFSAKFTSFGQQIKEQQDKDRQEFEDKMRSIDEKAGFIPDSISDWIIIPLSLVAIIALVLSIYSVCIMRRTYQPVSPLMMMLTLTFILGVACNDVHVHHITLDHPASDKSSLQSELDDDIHLLEPIMKHEEDEELDLTHVPVGKLNWILAFCILAFLLLLGIFIGIVLLLIFNYKLSKKNKKYRKSVELKNKTGIFLYNGTGIYCELLLSMKYKISPNVAFRSVIIHVSDISVSARDLTPMRQHTHFVGESKVYERAGYFIFPINWPFEGLYSIGDELYEFPREVSISKKALNREMANFLSVISEITILRVCRIFGKKGDEAHTYYEGECDSHSIASV